MGVNWRGCSVVDQIAAFELARKSAMSFGCLCGRVHEGAMVSHTSILLSLIIYIYNTIYLFYLYMMILPALSKGRR